MSLVEDLQAEALRADADLPNLLQRALVVATKLDLQKFRAWARLELDGYPGGVEVPQYRQLRGQLSYRNPFHGTQPALVGDSDLQEQISRAPMSDSVAQISHLVQSGIDRVQVVLPTDLQMLLMRYFQGPANFFLVVSTHHLRGILDSVKTELIDWTLRLEQDGIIGEGMRFSDAEKVKAVKDEAKLTPTFILNLIERMDNSQLQQFSPSASQNG